LKVHPFQIAVPDDAVADLKARLANTRWPDELEDAGWDWGVSLAYMRELVDYWGGEFDWRAQEQRLNAVPQFVAEIGGHDIHFLDVRAPSGNGIPLLITHGWPGSFVEMLRIIPLLTEDDGSGVVFDVIVPSLPGYGFSGRPRRGGVGLFAIADLWAQLMSGLGYDRFAVQGGDWGSGVSTALALRHAERLIAIHLNFSSTTLAKPEDPDNPLTQAELDWLARMVAWRREGSGYAAIQGTRPQTLAYAVNDSPAGLAAWIADKFHAWTDCGGRIENAVSRDDLLCNISIYWFTGTAASSFRLYREAHRNPMAISAEEFISVPAAFAHFPAEIPTPPRRWLERTFTDLRRDTSMPAGGHFAAMEQPELLAADIRALFRELA